MNLRAYLDRINYHGPLNLTAETLSELQYAHLLTVPFENLSIHLPEPITLEDHALFEKIIRRRRGGFCYEANGLFAALLRGLGFQVTMLSAGVAKADGGFGPEFDHMALMATLDEPWLVDVGFGDSFLRPLRINQRNLHDEGQRSYRIDLDGSRLILMQRDNARDDDWKAQYRFTLEPHEFPDYEGMCRYHQTSPESSFTRGRVCSIATPEGRVTLSEMRLIATRNGERRERTLANEEEYAEILRVHFGVVLKN